MMKRMQVRIVFELDDENIVRAYRNLIEMNDALVAYAGTWANSREGCKVSETATTFDEEARR